LANAKNPELKYEIINSIGVVSTSSSGWTTELNRVSWNGKEPKYDLRSWAPDHMKIGKGITLSADELVSLAAILQKEVEFLKEE
jgi:hypothetical protein